MDDSGSSERLRVCVCVRLSDGGYLDGEPSLMCCIRCIVSHAVGLHTALPSHVPAKGAAVLCLLYVRCTNSVAHYKQFANLPRSKTHRVIGNPVN